MALEQAGQKNKTDNEAASTHQLKEDNETRRRKNTINNDQNKKGTEDKHARKKGEVDKDKAANESRR